MKIIRTLRQRVDALLTTPGEELGRWARFVRFQMHLWRFCGRRLAEHNAVAMSAALSFRTIFALVPVLLLALLVMKPMGILGDRRSGVEWALKSLGLGFSQPSGDPGKTDGPTPGNAAASRPAEVGEVLSDHIVKLVEELEAKLTLGRVGPVGILLLIWSALALLTTIERSLNRIFGAASSRSAGRRLLMYWSVVTLGPVVLTAAAYMGQSLASSFESTPGLSGLLVTVGWIGPILVGVVLLAVLYKLMPNTKVPFRAAIGGAVVAVPLWLLAKWGFETYVGEVAQTSVYGTLGLIPLFLVWLNLSWLIFLFGAELAHTAVNLERMQMAELAERTVLGPSDLLAVALAVGGPYRRGEGAVAFDRIAAVVNLPAESLEKLLGRLTEAQITCPVGAAGAGGYVLARPAEQVTLAEVMSAGDAGAAGRSDDAIAARVEYVRQRTDTVLAGLTLADVLTEGPSN